MLLRLAQLHRTAAGACYRVALANTRGLSVRRRTARAKHGAGYRTRVSNATLPHVQLHMDPLGSTPFEA